MIAQPELSRPVRIDTLGSRPHEISIEASEKERTALAKRFGLAALDLLTAELSLTREAEEVRASGMLRAKVEQSCVATGTPVAATIEEPFDLLFRPQPAGSADEEVELSETELDVIFYDSASVDVGEAVAETLSLSLDPYPRAPDAAEALRAAGVKSEEEAGPFAALAALRDKLKP